MAGARPAWLPDGYDIDTSFNLSIRTISANMRAKWYTIEKIVDSDTTNFKDLVDEIVKKWPCDCGDVVKLFYFCSDSKSNIQINSDQDLMNMFAKHMTSKCCFMSIAYHKPDAEPPEVPLWDNVEIPCTPSIPTPSFVEPSKGTGTGTNIEPDSDMVEAENNCLLNPEPENEFMGGDLESLCIDIASSSHANAEKVQNEDGDSGSDSSSDSDMDVEVDEEVHDKRPTHIPPLMYDKDDPPMAVGSIYPDIVEFKLALATHAIKNEFQYNIEKSDPGRFRAYCNGFADGCKWKIHASTMSDEVTIKVRKNPYPHECHSTRRSGQVKGATKYWVCEKVKGWLAEDSTVGPMELQRRLKDHYKVTISYKRVYHGRDLALNQLYGDWKGSFDNLYRFKAQLEQSCPGSIFVIDHHTIEGKIRFNRLFLAMKPCVEGFLRGCRPYLAVDSTFLTGKFRGQLCIACAVDGHNWMYPVAIGVIDSETNENWCWFMERLKEAIGTPLGLTFCTDCGQAVMHGVSEVFPNAEHRECMWHLVQNFKKRGPPKKKKKKATPPTTETSIVLAAPSQRMVFPDLPLVVDNSNKRKKSSSSSTGAKKQKSTSNTLSVEGSDPSMRSVTGSNGLDLLPLSIMYPSGSSEQQQPITEMGTVQQQQKKKAIKKTIVKKDCSSPAMGTRSKVPSSPSSPAMGTRSKKKLNLS